MCSIKFLKRKARLMLVSSPLLRNEKLKFLLAMLAVVLTYNLLFFNRYFPITEGWFSVYSHYIRQGAVPYRDFYFFLTPLYAYLLAFFQTIFGDAFISLRILGVLVILMISTLLYLLLIRVFSKKSSAISAIVSVIYYQSGVAHIAYDFIQFFTLFSLAAAYFFIRYSEGETIENFRLISKSTLNLMLAGIFISLAFLTKQSNGTLLVLFSTVIAFYLTLSESKLIWQNFFLIYCFSMLIPVGLFLIYFSTEGALRPLIDQIFYGAISSKGASEKIFFAWFSFFNRSYYIFLFNLTLISVAFFLLCNVFAQKKFLSSNFIKENFLPNFFESLPFFFLTFSIWLSYKQIGSNLWMDSGRENLSYLMIASSISCMLALTFFTFYSSIFRQSASSNKAGIVFLLLSWGLVFGNGTSAGLSEVSAFLGIALILAYLLDSKNRLIVLSALLLSIFISYGFSTFKFTQPYAWWGVSSSDIRKATSSVNNQLLTGILLSPEQKTTLEALISVVDKNTSEKDEVFFFPNISGLYVLSNRWPISKVLVSWFDFLPDSDAEFEAGRLLSARPKVIMILRMPEYVWSTHEFLFRGGKPLGQRSILRVIDGLISDKSYKLLSSEELDGKCQLEVWGRI